MLKEKIISDLEKLKDEKRERILKENLNYKMNFSSNDYLSIASDENLIENFYCLYDDILKYKLSSSSSRLIDGSYNTVLELEKEVENIYKKPCIIFNSGYDANSSIIETFFNKDSLILCDRLNHASIYDGCISSKAKLIRYSHLNYAELESLLEKYKDLYKDILVVTETIYSMDGDEADIEKICNLKKKFNFTLMIDEAHSFGVHSYGRVFEKKLINFVDFLVIPLGKAGSSIGAYVICEDFYKKYIINKSRKFIFSTALAPVNALWSLFILKNLRNFSDRIKNLKNLTKFTHQELKKLKIKTESTSHIISIVIGDLNKCLKIANNLNAKGYLVYPIKEPTVPVGTSRLRISLCANMKKEDILNFLMELKNEIDNIL